MARSGTGFGEPAPADVLLTAALGRAVPQLIDHLQELPSDVRRKQLFDWQEGTAADIAATGDTVCYGGGKPGQIADAFAALAVGLAVLAHAPGGVTAFGQHWCANHVLCEHAQAEQILTEAR